MSTPPNIEVFNQVAAHTFVRLYEAFPSPVDLDPVVIGIGVVLKEQYEPESAHHKTLVNSTSDAIQYLIDESFIRLAGGAGDLGFRGFQSVVLTSKGFSLLQKTPESVDPTIDRRSYFDRLKSATASGVKTAAPEAIGAIIARLLGAG